MHLPSDQHEEASYIIFKKDGDIFARNGDSGNIEFSGTDFATVVNNAIEDLPNYGSAETHSGLIFIKEGVYTVSTPIQLYENTKIVGIGYGGDPSSGGTVLKAADSFNNNIIEYGPFGNNRYFAELRNIGLNGNNLNNTSGHCIFSDNSGAGEPRDLHLINVFAIRAAEDGAHLENAHGATISDCLFESSGRHGLYLGPNGVEPRLSNVAAILSGMAETGHGVMILTDRASGNIMVRSAGGDGVHIGSATVQPVELNLQIVSKNNDNYGVYDNSMHSTIRATCRGNGSTGYYVDRVYNLIFVQATGNGGYGVDASSSDYCVIETGDLYNNTSGKINGPAGVGRTVVNGLGQNAGDPNTTGKWNGNGYEGLIVRDTVNANTYIYNNGTWSQIAST